MSPRLFVAAALVVGVAIACSSTDDSSTCTCSVEVNGDKKDLTCGQSACVGGFSYTCSDGSASRAGDACAAASSTSGSTSGSSTTSSGSATSSSSGSGSDACADLANFCESKCKANQTVYSDCTKTASAGSGTKCVAWQSTNANLCK